MSSIKEFLNGVEKDRMERYQKSFSGLLNYLDQTIGIMKEKEAYEQNEKYLQEYSSISGAKYLPGNYGDPNAMNATQRLELMKVQKIQDDATNIWKAEGFEPDEKDSFEVKKSKYDKFQKEKERYNNLQTSISPDVLDKYFDAKGKPLNGLDIDTAEFLAKDKEIERIKTKMTAEEWKEKYTDAYKLARAVLGTEEASKIALNKSSDYQQSYYNIKKAMDDRAKAIEKENKTTTAIDTIKKDVTKRKASLEEKIIKALEQTKMKYPPIFRDGILFDKRGKEMTEKDYEELPESIKFYIEKYREASLEEDSVSSDNESDIDMNQIINYNGGKMTLKEHVTKAKKSYPNVSDEAIIKQLMLKSEK